MKLNTTKAALQCASGIAVALMACAAPVAHAQTTPADDASVADTGEAIIVTGSRIRTELPTTAAPVQVVSSAQIQSTGAVNIQDTLLQNPVFGTPTYSRTNSSFNTSGAGIATVDLRNLGVDRTLVLINGRRVVSGVPGSAAVDLNMIPTQMLDRVEVLTSGSASAVYGSDAVAGVVNFILKDNFSGIQVDAKSGIAETGDDRTIDASVMAGHNFSDDRGNITLFLGYSKQGAAYMKNHYTEAGRSDTDSLSGAFFGDNPFVKYAPKYSGYAPGGTYYTDNGAFTYGPNGLQPCFAQNVATCSNDLGTGVGPNGFNRSAYRYLAIPLQRYTAFLNAHYDFSDAAKLFVEGSFVRTKARSNIEPFPFDTSYAYDDGQMPIETLYNGTVYRNPYVPDAIYNDASDTNGDGLKDIFVTKRLADFGPRASSSKQDTFRIVAGLRGEIAPKWTYEVFGNYGKADVKQHGTGQINVLNFASSQQIVPDGNGGYMCADATARANGCIPANVFGPGSLTPALGYLAAPSYYHAVQKQLQIGGNIAGAFTNPLGAADIGINIGAEYRKEKQDARWDELQTLGLNGGNALPPTFGSFNVKEVYGELLLPLVTHGFVDDFSIRGAARYSDYSTVGRTFSWNAGAELAPIPDIRFRAMYAQTVRAPNINELYQGLSQDFPTVTDPCQGVKATGDAPSGVSGDLCRAAPGVMSNIAANGGTFTLTQSDIQGVTSFSGGNPKLSEEKGKTLTLGVVIAPKSIAALRDFTLTVDYFRVKVSDAIVSTPLSFILNQCYTSGKLCDFIVRRPAASGPNSAGSLDEVNTGNTNSGGIKTSGIDVVFNWASGFDMGNTRLNASLNVAYTHLLSGKTIPLVSQPDVDYFEGEVGAAKDRFTTTAMIGTEAFKLTATGTYYGPSWLNDQDFGYHEYKVHSEFYLDLQARFMVAKDYEFFVGADNVFNNKPAYFAGIPDATTGMESDTGTYDPLGRRFYAGFKAMF